MLGLPIGPPPNVCEVSLFCTHTVILGLSQPPWGCPGTLELSLPYPIPRILFCMEQRVLLGRKMSIWRKVTVIVSLKDGRVGLAFPLLFLFSSFLPLNLDILHLKNVS